MYNDKFTINDCSEQVNLEFGIDGGIWSYQSQSEQSQAKKKILKQIKDRRAKIRMLRDAVNGFADALESSLDEIHAKVIGFEPKPPDDRSK
jgi:cytochrome c556